ncbi:MAG TPA: enoyl-CoA hydratase [Hyphomicrobiaceae bacterium]|nr:enoyl-CoA hydratase [Hyphomicrobiaceae bacterium]
MPETDKMIARRDGAVGWMIFNNPARHNAVSLEMWQRAAEILEEFAEDKSIRVVVLTGAGGKAFVSGADISRFKDERQEAEAIAIYQAATDKAYETLRAVPVPTIAMIRGYCIGGGTALAVACDLRVATENSRFGVPAAKLGLGYGPKRAKLLVDLVGPAYAKEIYFTARQFDAQEALRMGLVNRVVPDDKLEATVADMAGAIAENAPLTIRSTKLTVNELMKDPAERDLAACEAAVAACFASNDYREGQAAFMEKRKPRFTGT